MEWIALIAAGLCEVLGVIALRRVALFRSFGSYLFLTCSLGSSFLLLTYAMNFISMGTAYAIWTGMGTAGSTLLGMFAFGEPKEWRRVFFISLILASVIGLKMIT
ncbi:QacE family quaternary ammonium compound efflux SMR transporter [Paenibacillus glucanolyticus]|jgi:paired small multidrug resistance pump|uniref:Transporter n=1 Tax=Paenibacillus glucanolyticus TaxID=59843 RepID=A0A163EP83_9BACL|nr:MULTISPECIES: multidrug efflux SMR transporter [Paenibacillus]ANA78525.1 transporter [Paenibacillus glucanolyticus]AVV57558.1 QacE family quaternary ammonium compound efflux SMR transporter [Paenibacillus glucanolyticus]AWP26720.1 QacE family quaternary ammonium compound efflux SMR transporter [Paenibacillus sp. Cedars]ETT34997.1 small multidrug resistance protein [Paenibacillus sp. FSL R5-808]KZS43921.1 transporter [Paenibacillus glucanolyticus]